MSDPEDTAVLDSLAAEPVDGETGLREALGMSERPSPPRLAAGQVIDDAYRIDDELGAGGMGRVYRARDLRLGRDLAIKLHATTALDAARLVREASALARLAHPNVVTVFEVGTWTGHPWVAMEYVPGGNARAWLEAKPRTQREIIALYVAAGEGLAAAHAAGLVHRDFKPDNVLVGDDGRARVADFGLARDAGDVASGSVATGAVQHVTGTGLVIGTPAYMAPEQWSGGELGPAVDQFAFAIALWEALAGARPFAGNTDLEIVQALEKPPRDPPAGKIPRYVERALRRALARDPAERWPAMSPLLDELRRDPARARKQLALGGGAVGVAAIAVYLAWPANARSCDVAGAEIDELLPASLVEAAARRGDAARIEVVANAIRTRYREASRTACTLASLDDAARAAHTRCLQAWIATARHLFAADIASSSVLPVVLAIPALDCESGEITAPEAEAALVLAEHGELEAGGRLALPDSRQGQLARATLAYERIGDLDPAALEQAFAARAEDRSAALIAARLAIRNAVHRRDRAAAKVWIDRVRDELVPRQREHAYDTAIVAATALIELDEPTPALEILAKAVVLVPETPRHVLAAQRVRTLAFGLLRRHQNAMQASTDHVQRARELYGPEHALVVDVLAIHGSLQVDLGYRKEGFETLHDAAKLLAAQRDPTLVNARTSLTIGEVFAEADDDVAATPLLDRARRLFEARLDPRNDVIARVDLSRAVLRIRAKDPSGAIALLQPAVRDLEDPVLLSNALYNLAVAARDLKRVDEAVAALARAAKLDEQYDPKSHRHARTRLLQASILNDRGEFAAATEHAKVAYGLIHNDPEFGAWARFEAARALIGTGKDPELARQFLLQAQAMYMAVGQTEHVAEVEALAKRLK